MAILWHDPDAELNPDKIHRDFFHAPPQQCQFLAKIHKAGKSYRVYVPPKVLKHLSITQAERIFWLSDTHLLQLPAENAKRRTIVFVPQARTAFLQLSKELVEQYENATHIMFDIQEESMVHYAFVKLE